jgi:hypothetical protein
MKIGMKSVFIKRKNVQAITIWRRDLCPID